MRRFVRNVSVARTVSVQPDRLSPHDWLERQPLKPSEQLLAIFSNASAAEPFNAWQRSITVHAPSPIWADTAYAEWEPVMPYVGIVAAGSEFLEWVATTESRDWGWLAVSSASEEVAGRAFAQPYSSEAAEWEGRCFFASGMGVIYCRFCNPLT